MFKATKLNFRKGGEQKFKKLLDEGIITKEEFEYFCGLFIMEQKVNYELFGI